MATFSRNAVLQWEGDVQHGSGHVAAGAESFSVPATYPHSAGEPAGRTTPEELLAASHATCYGIGLRSLIGRHGGIAKLVTVTVTVTAEKGPNGIRIQSSHIDGMVEGLEKIDEGHLQNIALEVAQQCTISIALRGSVRITHEVKSRTL